MSDKKRFMTPFNEYSLRRVLMPLLFLGIAITIGTCGYLYIEKMPLLDALYMTIITIATVGYREVHPLSQIGKIFTIFFIVFGVATVVYTAGTIIEFIVEGHLEGVRRRRQMNKKLEEMKDHFIVCGFGRVGHQIAAEFDIEKIPYVVIDVKPRTAEELEPKGAPFVIGPVSSDEILEKAGIRRAKGLIAAADSDTENVFTTLSAREMNPNLYIIARAGQRESESKLKRAGANRVMLPYFTAGSRMASMAIRPVSVEFLDIVIGSENIEMWMREIKINENSHLANKTLGEAKIRQNSGAMILSIKKNNGQFDLSPKAESKMEIGDIIIVLGTVTQLGALEKLT